MKGSHAVVRLVLVCAVVLVTGIGGLAKAPQPEGALGTAFTYQGRLTDNGSPAEGAYDFEFKLYDAPGGGNRLGTVTAGDVPVSGGLFTVKLDFGSGVFSGDARWLEIGVRPGDSSGAYTTLDPRQELTPSPYALALPGLWTQQNGISPNLIGGYSDNWTTAGVAGATIGGGGDISWPNRVTDNYGTVGGGQGNQAGDGDGDPTGPRHATVGGGYQNTASGWGAVVGGGGGNVAGGDVATIAGGHQNTASGSLSAVGGGQSNQAMGNSATVGGGGSNTASGDSSTIGGGGPNIASGYGTTVAGGISNTATIQGATVGGGYDNAAEGDWVTVGGGANNVADGNLATVAGGHVNTAGGEAASVGGGESNSASGEAATVGGGGWNSASQLWATVAGGNTNAASGSRATVSGGTGNTASGDWATIAGGANNTASGDYATVGGGNINIAQGDYSFAVGHRAEAYNSGCFVWGDSSAADVTCDNDNRWVARASGGVYFYTNSGLSSGVYVPAGGNAWSTVSDRNLKDNVAAVDGQELLARLAQVPVTTWNYKSQDAAIRHMGPMAQDFYSAFGLGEDDTHISTVDADGVALAAIQGLYAENQALKAENADQKAQIATLQQQNAGLDARVTALEQAVRSGQPAQARSGVAVPWLLAGGLVVAGGTLVGRRRRPGGGR